MSKEKDKMFLQLMGLDNEANITFNRAVMRAKEDRCACMTLVHVLIAMAEKSNVLDEAMKINNITLNDMENAYSDMLDLEKFGFESEPISFSPDYFSPAIFIVAGIASKRAYFEGKDVGCNEILEIILDIVDSNELLLEFMDRIGLNIDTMQKKAFSIPQAIADFVTDLNSSDKIKNMTLCNVDDYVTEAFEVLSRKNKANPCLIGPAGVGKTSVAYGIVQAIINGKAPEQFKGAHICYINGAMLTAGTRYRGDFEARMKYILDWATDTGVILFLDEIHTFINAGKSSEDSAETAGNMIKTALADGDIKIIGTTTLSEYHKYIEKDSAFDRRLQAIEIKEPSVSDTITMISNSIEDYEKYHNVKISDEIIELAVKLSDRYMKNRYLPDKAYTIIDQASARTKMKRKIKVTEADVLSVVSKNCGVNVNKLSKNEASSLLSLEDNIEKRVIGQTDAVKTVCKAIRRAKSGVREPNKPIASLLFVGPTGVGKTELCKVLKEELNLGRDAFIKVDMSEFGDKVSVNKLIGSAPGYVGYGEGGQLTEKVKHNPYSIVLFDEIEKAHPDVFNTFLQLLDEGRLTDDKGQTVDFTNCIVVMTSNAGYGADRFGKSSIGFGNASTNNTDDANNKEKIAINALEATFKPEFLNRVDNIVIFNKLDKDACRRITVLMLKQLSDRIKDSRGLTVKFSTKIVTKLCESGYSEKYGARNIKREIQNIVEDKLSDAILRGDISTSDVNTIDYVDNDVVIKYNS